jgi:hypothetical protein
MRETHKDKDQKGIWNSAESLNREAITWGIRVRGPAMELAEKEN